MTNYKEQIIGALGYSSKFIDLYDSTSGNERKKFINAMGGVLEDEKVGIDVKSKLVEIISDIDIAQLDEKMIKLSKKPEASEGTLNQTINYYFQMRERFNLNS